MFISFHSFLFFYTGRLFQKRNYFKRILLLFKESFVLHLIGIDDVDDQQVDVYRSPGEEEDDADHHQDQVRSSPPGQLPLLSLAPDNIPGNHHGRPRFDRDGNPGR